jgi:site-specific recombinase XerD
MTLRERIVDHVEQTISAEEAHNVHNLIGLMFAYFADGLASVLGATAAQLSDFLHSRYSASTKTFARRLSTMRLIYSILVEWEMVGRNPAMEIKRPATIVNATDFDVFPVDVERLVACQEGFVRRTDGLGEKAVHRELAILATVHLVACGALLAELEGLVVCDLLDDAIVVGRCTPRERLIWPSNQALHAIRRTVHSARSLPPAPNAPFVLTGYGVRLNLQNAWCQLRKAIVRAGLDGLGLTPAKIHRAAAKGLLEQGFGWNAARNPSAYRRIPKTDYAPSLDEMEQAIARCHPLEFV